MVQPEKQNSKNTTIPPIIGFQYIMHLIQQVNRNGNIQNPNLKQQIAGEPISTNRYFLYYQKI
jgi:hypothetical protein